MDGGLFHICNGHEEIMPLIIAWPLYSQSDKRESVPLSNIPPPRLAFLLQEAPFVSKVPNGSKFCWVFAFDEVTWNL